jgi:hypothetical protein
LTQQHVGNSQTLMFQSGGEKSRHFPAFFVDINAVP